MREQLEQRLNQLKAEYAAGQQRLAELEAQAASLRETLARIGGAIQALEAELEKAAAPAPGPLTSPARERIKAP